MPAVEPLDFFSYKYENGYRWYEQQFPVRPNVHCAGEMSQSYLHEAGVAERVKKYRSDVRTIVTLRDPVERAVSQHRHLVRLGRIPTDDLSFERGLETNPTYVEQGRYITHVTHWMEVLSPGQIHIIFMDDIIADPSQVVRNLYRFLQVSDAHRPAVLNKVSNASYVPRYRGLDRMVGRVSSTVDAIGARKLWNIVGDTGLRSAYRRFNRQASMSVIPEPKTETLEELRRLFAPEIERLGRLTGRSLEHWLRRPDGVR